MTFLLEQIHKVKQLDKMQLRSRIPVVAHALYVFHARYRKGDPVTNLLDILEVRNDWEDAKLIYNDLEAVTENGAVQFFTPDWRTALRE